MKEIFNKNLTRILEEKGIEINDFARMIDMKYPNLYKVVNQKRDIRISTLKKIKKALEVSWDDLLND